MEELIDMSLFQRARDVLAAKANKALHAAEKPDEMLDLSTPAPAPLSHPSLHHHH